MFNSKNSDKGITAAEAEAYAAELRREAAQTFVSVEQAQPYVDALSALDRRVASLETLASSLRRSGGVLADVQRVTSDTPDEVSSVTTEQSSRSTIDYGAIAFGLTEIKRKVAGLVGQGDSSVMAEEYKGTVQYFADVFKKSDPSFNEAEFKRQAGLGGREILSPWTPQHP
jgi:hypothetical protein